MRLFNPLPSHINLPRHFTNPFDYTPSEVVRVAAAELTRYLNDREEWGDELRRGKMFGVLVVQCTNGDVGYLSAFSGNLGGQTRQPLFVPPILDLHDEDSHFRVAESQISQINVEIKQIEESASLRDARQKLESCRCRCQSEISDYKALIKSSKANRDNIRKSAQNQDLLPQLIAESQFQKAELRRIEARCREEVSNSEMEVLAITGRVEELKSQRQSLSRGLQREIFDSYMVLNHRGESLSMTDIFQSHRNTPPPSGAGECAAPKLLHYAFANGMRPISMGEFWWGDSPNGEVRHHGAFYASCKSKCEPILGYMLKGMTLDVSEVDYSIKRDLRVVYQDEWLAVVDKPAGMLSVAGRVDCPSVESLLPILFAQSPDAKVVHRLDMDTSGILIVALDHKTHSSLQRQFAQRSLYKEYLALLDGVVKDDVGEVNLPLTSDYEHRPRQRVDYVEGKEAQTLYRVISRDGGQTRISLTPHTGRTHQLRVHCAHEDGVGLPIVGDRLYGSPSSRLMLQAIKITFTHPETLERLTFEVDAEF